MIETSFARNKTPLKIPILWTSGCIVAVNQAFLVIWTALLTDLSLHLLEWVRRTYRHWLSRVTRIRHYKICIPSCVGNCKWIDCGRVEEIGNREVWTYFHPLKIDASADGAQDNAEQGAHYAPHAHPVQHLREHSLYKGTKIDSRKEAVEGETYLGIQIFWFHFKCNVCAAELTMKTDPQNSTYIMHTGGNSSFWQWSTSRVFNFSRLANYGI